MVLNIGIAVQDILIEPTIPKNDSLFGFCAIVNNTLAYFMHADDTSVRILGNVCKKTHNLESFTDNDGRNQINTLLSK